MTIPSANEVFDTVYDVYMDAGGYEKRHRPVHDQVAARVRDTFFDQRIWDDPDALRAWVLGVVFGGAPDGEDELSDEQTEVVVIALDRYTQLKETQQ